MPHISSGRLRLVVSDTLEAAGLSPLEASACADAAIFADIRGAHTHGIAYTIPRQLESISAGKTRSGSQPEIVRDSGATLFARGTGVVGPLLGRWAMDAAVDRANRNGVGMVNTSNGGPIGLLGYYAHRAAEKGIVGIVMANTAPAAAPHGGTRAVLGTNPFAYAAPSRDSAPILFDIATTVVSSGKLAAARRQGKAFPEGWLVDAGGRPVVDPAQAAAGVMLPCGGHKGSGFSILIHLLTGALSGTTVGGDETHNNPAPERRGQNALFIAIDPDAFGGRDVFLDLVERQIGFIHASGDNQPLYPGERGWSQASESAVSGVTIDDADWQMIVGAITRASLPAALLTQDV